MPAAHWETKGRTSPHGGKPPQGLALLRRRGLPGLPAGEVCGVGPMSKLLLAVLLAILPSCASAERSSWRVDFAPPAGFTPLPSAETAGRASGLASTAAAAAGQPPAAVGSRSRLTTITYSVKAGLLPMPSDQADLDAFVAMLKRGVLAPEVLSTRLETINERQWVYCEMVTRGLGMAFHNIMLFSALGDETVFVNVNSELGEFPEVEASLRESLKTIVVRRDVL